MTTKVTPSGGFMFGAETVRDWCERNGLPVRWIEEEALLIVGVQELPRMPIRVMERRSAGLVSIGQVMPERIPEDRRDAVALAMSRVNARIYSGAWAISHSSGEAMFRMALPAHATLPDDSIERMLRLMVGTVAATAPGLQAVAEGAATESVLGTIPQPETSTDAVPDWATDPPTEE